MERRSRASHCVRPKRAGAAFCEPATWLLFPATAPQNQKNRHEAVLLILVEVARIELASASPLLRGLHAYSVFNLTAGYPTGRENSQPVR